jgi:hypothetical protein
MPHMATITLAICANQASINAILAQFASGSVTDKHYNSRHI